MTQVQDDLASISGRYLEQLRRRGQVQPVHDGEDGLGDVVGDRVSDTGVDDGRICRVGSTASFMKRLLTLHGLAPVMWPTRSTPLSRRWFAA